MTIHFRSSCYRLFGTVTLSILLAAPALARPPRDPKLPIFDHGDVRDIQTSKDIKDRLNDLLEPDQNLVGKNDSFIIPYKELIAGIWIPDQDKRCDSTSWKTGFLEALSGFRVDDIRLSCEELDVDNTLACKNYRHAFQHERSEANRLGLACCNEAFLYGQAALYKKIQAHPDADNGCSREYAKAHKYAENYCLGQPVEVGCMVKSSSQFAMCRSLGYLIGRAENCGAKDYQAKAKRLHLKISPAKVKHVKDYVAPMESVDGHIEDGASSGK